MNIKITAGSTGSSEDALKYLDKENELIKDEAERRYLFDHERKRVTMSEAQSKLDFNKFKLSKKLTKFYQLIISPSEAELRHINCDEKSLRDYTRRVMDAYAENFKKGLKGSNLLYFAKIEEFRKDEKGNYKPGLNWHIHVLVSRRDKLQKFKLSPLTNHINSKNGPIRGGFDRNKLRQNSELIFDQMFGYQRDTTQSFEYQNLMKNGKQASDKVFARNYASANPLYVFGGLTAALRGVEYEDPAMKKKRRRNKEEDKDNSKGLSI